MNHKLLNRFLQEKCKSLDPRARSLVRDVLLKLPESFDIESISEVFPLYAGSAYPAEAKRWVILIEWDVLNAPFEASAKDVERKKEVAKGVIALNLAHCALRHRPDTIHSRKAYHQARSLAIQWGFSKEIRSMERDLL